MVSFGWDVRRKRQPIPPSLRWQSSGTVGHTVPSPFLPLLRVVRHLGVPLRTAGMEHCMEWRKRHSNCATLYHQGHISALGPEAQRATLHLLPTAYFLSQTSSVKSFPPSNRRTLAQVDTDRIGVTKVGSVSVMYTMIFLYHLYAVSLNSAALTTDTVCQKSLDVIILSWWHLMYLNMECNWNSMQKKDFFVRAKEILLMLIYITRI